MQFTTITGNGATERTPGRSRRGNEADRGFRGAIRRRARTAASRRPCAAFTLAEVLAAMMFMAIVIPVAVEALHVASASGEIAVRKAAAARIADRVLNDSLVTTNWNQFLTGSLQENGIEYRWTLRSEYWQPESAMQLVTAEVEYSVQGRPHSLSTSTLANSPSATTATLR